MNFPKLFRRLADEFGWDPERVSWMTFPQAVMYLIEAGQLEPSIFEHSIRFRDRLSFVRWYRQKQAKG